MKIVVDTSIIIGALVRRSYLLFTLLKVCRKLEVLSPDFLREELMSKIDKIVRLSKLSESEVKFALNTLLDYIQIIPMSSYSDKIDEAREIAEEFDYNDYPFIALALKLDAPIWTNDREIIKHGLKTGKYLALDTQAVEELLRGKNLDEIKDDLKRRFFSLSLMNPLVSIVVPTYNSERSIEICLKSLVNQSYNDIEIIVVDGFSRENC